MCLKSSCRSSGELTLWKSNLAFGRPPKYILYLIGEVSKSILACQMPSMSGFQAGDRFWRRRLPSKLWCVRAKSQEPNKPEDIDMFFVDVAQIGNTLHGFSLVFGESPESSILQRSTLAANRIGGLSCSMGNFNVPQRFATKIKDTRWWLMTSSSWFVNVYDPSRKSRDIFPRNLSSWNCTPTYLGPLGNNLPAWHDQLPSQGATCHEHSHCSIMIMIYQWSLNDFILPLVIYY